jgi:PleD family two-component response regulator
MVVSAAETSELVVGAASPAAGDRLGQDEPMDESGCVLVVDDEANMRRMPCTYLRKAGFAVVEAGSGLDALSVLRSEQVDLRSST